MATEDFKRKLTAIFSADVAGYSRLMGEDEAATVKTLASYREIMASLIKQHRGRVVDSPGDNVLAEFVSVVDAVQCAVAVQKELQTRNTDLPESRRMEFRIGINLGDVIDEEDRIYGDGVNIAARLEALADPGGICISKTAFDQIETKLPLGYEFLGEQDVKNIAKPVGAYRVLMDAEAAGKVIGEVRPKTKQMRGVAIGAVAVLIIVAVALAIWNFYLRPAFEPASVERMAFPLPDKPSIAVLPFTNLSGDPEQEYFSDGLTEEIITALSKTPRLFVIARNSTFTYKGKPVKVNQVAEELGVRYVLEGSVRRAGERVRITAQLIDALTGHHLWAERYDKDLRDIFDLQDEIAMKVLTELQVKLTEGEVARLVAKGTDNIQAYLKYLQAREHWLTQTKEGNALARRLLEEVIALEPEFPAAYNLLGSTHWMESWLQTSDSPKASLERAFELTRKALDLDESSPLALRQLGLLYSFIGKHDKAIVECERALALDPNSHTIHVWMSSALSFAGRYEEAVKLAEQALRLNPIPTGGQLRVLGIAYRGAGRYEEAITAFKKALIRTPNDILSHLSLASAFSMAGRMEEAQAAVEQVLKINPKYSLEYLAKRLTYKDKAYKDRVISALRKAGLPETPPLPLPDKPSIAVLPFVNMSGDPEQDYFSDGITESIITGLSKTPRLFIIARNSAFTYKGKPTKVQKIGRELGVRYVLEGSVQKSADRVRITAQLVDAKSGNHVWSEQYDRELKEVFALQDEITMKILTSLQVKLTMGEHARVFGSGTNNLEAYLKVLQARSYMNRMNKEDNVRAKQLAEEAVALDPEYASAYMMLGWSHLFDVVWRSSKSPTHSLAQASELAHKALAIDESQGGGAHCVLGYIYVLKKEHEKAIAEMEQCVASAPNSARRLMHLGRVLTRAGRLEEAVHMLEKGLRLDPMPGSVELYFVGHAYLLTGRYDEAIAAFKRAIEMAPRNVHAHVYLTSAYSLSGREQEARTQAEELLRIDPKYCASRTPRVSKNPEDDELISNALRKAGLPDCPPRRGAK
jgi:adenylate cyclase